MKKNCVIEGKQIRLREPDEKDAYGKWWEWFNDREVTRYMNKGNEKNTPEKQLAFLKKTSQSENDFILAICLAGSGRHIGTVGIHNIREEANEKTGNFGIIIGEREYWGRGIGTEAWLMMTGYAFSKLGLDSIQTKIFAENNASLKIAGKIGFKAVSLLKKDLLKNGRYIDRLLLKIDKDCWNRIKPEVKHEE